MAENKLKANYACNQLFNFENKTKLIHTVLEEVNEINVYNNLNENKLEIKLTTKEKVTKLHKKRNRWLMRGPLSNQVMPS